MCGFAGQYRLDSTAASGALVERMADRLAARGPDGAGVYQQGRIALAHRRLKIIDLSEQAAQPMVDPELGLAIVFNGCIYNYRELRMELEGAGYRFFSQGDTEVILKAYHRWGRACVARFHGMFAFAIYEQDSGRVCLARDRFGIKPLYVARQTASVAFASTLPALLCVEGLDTRIDKVALQHYLTFHSVVPAPRTLLAGVQKVPPATTVVIDPTGGWNESTYWSLAFEPDPRPTAADWQDTVMEALERAVVRRVVADVPVGVLLSGGLDSSLIVALLRAAGQGELATYSIGFQSMRGEPGDEFYYSDLVASRFETRHHKIFIGPAETLANLDACIHAMSEPMVSHDNIGFFLLSREVSRSIKVVQSGQGADEVFAGYHWYPPLADARTSARDYARVFFDRDHAEYARLVGPEYFCETDEAMAFVERWFSAVATPRAVDKALHLDTHVMLIEDPVKRVDNMTMAWGLEGRVPFLDHELVELAARIPAEHKLANCGKGVLKAVARRFLPPELIDRPKGYFPVPALKYLEGEFLTTVRDTLLSARCRERGIFRGSAVQAMLRNPGQDLTPLQGSKLWQAALLERWLTSHGL